MRRMLSQAEMRAAVAEHIASLSLADLATFRAATEFVLEMAASVLNAPAADRAAAYDAAKAEGARRGLVVARLPEAFDADAERYLLGFLPVAAAAEHVTRGDFTTH